MRGNQNVYGVARENNVSMRDIIVLNDLRAPFTLKAGQKLTLPANAKPSATASYYARSGGEDAPQIVAASPQSAGTSNYAAGVSSTSVEQADLPPLPLQKPQSTLSTAQEPTNSVVAEKQAAEQSAPSPVLAQSAAPGATTGVFAPTPSAATEPQENADAAEPGNADLVWPVQGPVLSSFGPKGQGLSNDGLNISAPKGSPVVAAASGIVVYSGNEIKGFGNLVLIRHQGGMVTAYAHLDRAMVNKDTVVAQGDMIGTVGKTGNVPSPQLHFEVRSHGKPVDPEKFLKAAASDKTTQG